MQCVTAVDGHWLAELGPMFFSVKESVRTRLVCEHHCSPNETARFEHLPPPMHAHTSGEEASSKGETFSDGG